MRFSPLAAALTAAALSFAAPAAAQTGAPPLIDEGTGETIDDFVAPYPEGGDSWRNPDTGEIWTGQNEQQLPPLERSEEPVDPDIAAAPPQPPAPPARSAPPAPRESAPAPRASDPAPRESGPAWRNPDTGEVWREPDPRQNRRPAPPPEIAGAPSGVDDWLEAEEAPRFEESLPPDEDFMPGEAIVEGPDDRFIPVDPEDAEDAFARNPFALPPSRPAMIGPHHAWVVSAASRSLTGAVSEAQRLARSGQNAQVFLLDDNSYDIVMGAADYPRARRILERSRYSGLAGRGSRLADGSDYVERVWAAQRVLEDERRAGLR